MTISEAMTPRRYSWLSALIIVMTVVTLATGAIALHYVETRMVTAFGKSLALTAAEVSDKLDRFLFERYGDVMMMAGTFSAQLARRHERARTDRGRYRSGHGRAGLRRRILVSGRA